jgi:hypothetical protein
MSDVRKPLWSWIVALLIGLPLLYVAGFGPACALVEHDVLSQEILVTGFFRPCLAIVIDGPAPAGRLISTWADCCGGEFALAEAIARTEFELAPYRGVTGGLFR